MDTLIDQDGGPTIHDHFVMSDNQLCWMLLCVHHKSFVAVKTIQLDKPLIVTIITDREVLSVSIVIGVVAVFFFSAAMVDTPYSKI